MAGRATLLRFHNRVTGFVSPPSFTSQNSLDGQKAARIKKKTTFSQVKSIGG